jgi:hypothetical protein
VNIARDRWMGPRRRPRLDLAALEKP